eukprot:TRINITY_DN5295_c0_g1_i1.p1 TRINITY_DN5295_c0_g1~~TRINITY_DN5295_c0_g1_i1.p1  ORF type:complete len:296 (+),score=37.34 TRINITY_DN5295_c0_g1_i1:558-1445(+)
MSHDYTTIVYKLVSRSTRKRIKRLLNVTVWDLLSGLGIAVLKAATIGGYVMWGISMAGWVVVTVGAGWWRDKAPLAGDATLCWGLGVLVALQAYALWSMIEGWDSLGDGIAGVPARLVAKGFETSMGYLELFFGGLSVEGLQFQALQQLIPHAQHLKTILPVASLGYSWYLLAVTPLLPITADPQKLPSRLLYALLLTYTYPFAAPVRRLGARLGLLPSLTTFYYLHRWPLFIIPPVLLASVVGYAVLTSLGTSLFGLYKALRARECAEAETAPSPEPAPVVAREDEPKLVTTLE